MAWPELADASLRESIRLDLAYRKGEVQSLIEHFLSETMGEIEVELPDKNEEEPGEDEQPTSRDAG